MNEARWEPEENGILIGRIQSRGVFNGKFGPVPTVTIKDKSEGVSYCLFLSTVLKSLFEEANPRIGESVAIQYLGKHPEKGYHRYHMAVNRPGEREFHRLAGKHGHQTRTAMRPPEAPEARKARLAAAETKLAAAPAPRLLPAAVDGETQRRQRDKRSRPSEATSERAAVLAVVRTQRLAPSTGPVSRGPAVADPDDPFCD